MSLLISPNIVPKITQIRKKGPKSAYMLPLLSKSTESQITPMQPANDPDSATDSSDPISTKHLLCTPQTAPSNQPLDTGSIDAFSTEEKL